MVISKWVMAYLKDRDIPYPSRFTDLCKTGDGLEHEQSDKVWMILTDTLRKARREAIESCAVIAEEWKTSLISPTNSNSDDFVEEVCNSVSVNIAQAIRESEGL